MSETGRKLDVEDVLSSIRRLVSEEARGDTAANRPRVATDPPAKAPPPDKLVLTPSLRVPETEKPVPTSEIERRISDIESLVKAEARTTTSTAQPAAPVGDPAGMIAALNDSLRDLADDVSDHDTSDQDDIPDMATQPDPIEPADLSVDAFDDEDGDTVGADWDMPVRDDAAESREMVEDEAPFVDMDDDVPSPEPEKEPETLFHADAGSEDDAAPADEPQHEATDETDFIADAEFEDITDTDDDVSAAQEAAIVPPLRAPRIEREETPGDDDVAAVDDEPVLRATREAPAFEERIDYTADDDSGAYIDEDMLREIVSEMVRSELQGELGDRITRNVRKLVRREIHRALASREFE